MSRSRRARLAARSEQAACTARVVAPTPPPLFMKVMTFPGLAFSTMDMAPSSRPVRVARLRRNRQWVDMQEPVGINDRYLASPGTRSGVRIVQVKIGRLPQCGGGARRDRHGVASHCRQVMTLGGARVVHVHGHTSG